jgi:drug/metabolite transporter (DMT)-like permease
MTAVLLALGSASTFGAMTVAIRRALARGNAVPGGSLALLLVGLLITAAAALVRHDPAGAWKFFLAGLLAPGASQLLFTAAVAEAGASRASAVGGSAPLVALAIAFSFLHEPVKIALVIGGVAIVSGGVLLASERGRPGHLRARGLLYAAAAAVCFAVRDSIVRALHAHGSPETAAAAAVLGGVLVGLAASRRLPSRSELRAFAPAGVLFAISYLMLFEAYFHGRLSVVSPLVATETLWGVGLAALVLGRSEGLGRRVVLGAAGILVGGIVIGIAASG